MNHDHGQRSDDIAADIERARRDIDETLTAIEQKLSPGQLLDQGIDYLRHSGGAEFASNLRDSVKQNPLPVALVGVGVAWLMASGRGNGRETSDSHDSDSTSLGARASETLHRAADAVESAKDRIESAKERISETAHGARERVVHVSDSARDQFDRARRGYETILHEQPLVLAATGLAIGAIVAAVVPRTRREDELMGPTKDRLAEQAAQAGEKQLQKVQEVAAAATEAAQHAAKDEDHPQEDQRQASPPAPTRQTVDSAPPSSTRPGALAVSTAAPPNEKGQAAPSGIPIGST